MKIIAGRWRGRALVAPAGQATRPTAQRLRQALFDMLAHAPWGGRALIEGAAVLDGFAGTGALGLEALSRGAAGCEFYETDPAALVALQANISACGAGAIAFVRRADARDPAPGPVAGLVFLDPPYRRGLLDEAVASLVRRKRIDATTVVVCELARDEMAPVLAETLAQRTHGAGRLIIGRVGDPESFNTAPQIR